MVNIDTGTANAFIAEDSPIVGELNKFVEDKQMVMTETAFGEFTNIVSTIAGPKELKRAEQFIARVTIIKDDPSDRAKQLTVTKKVGANDKIIFGTADKYGIITMTADAKFVRGAEAQDVRFWVYLHEPVPLKGE
ncbi:DUF1308 domain-containing protein [Mesorhizobium sp. M00.F.Ca.ET.186.01.1.1]|nr:DUF1308 domain-containing protein [Mesorhizobium sp. M00.F.Ca.ET.186.01.1.1]